MYEIAMGNNLIDIINIPKPHKVVAATEDGKQVPFKTLQVKSITCNQSIAFWTVNEFKFYIIKSRIVYCCRHIQYACIKKAQNYSYNKVQL